MPSRRLVTAAFAVSVVVLAAAAGAGYFAWRLAHRPSPAQRGDPLAAIGDDFQLRNQHGGTTRLSELRGKALLMFFGYTHCPDICPSTLYSMSQARKLLGSEGERLQGIFITVDPARDTPERLREYLSYFDPTFLGLTGSDAELSAVAKAFGASFQREGGARGADYLMGHTTFGYLLDTGGRVVKLFPASASAEDLAAGARSVLAQSR
jgi:protein SCO1/2